jgi:hypothetical protein
MQRVAWAVTVVDVVLAAAVARGQVAEVTQTDPENSPTASHKSGFLQQRGAWPGGVQSFPQKRPARWRRGKPIDARQAVRIAERFVHDNGYTDYVPDNLLRIAPESFDFSRNPYEWFKYRHGLLKPQAVGYRKGSRNDPKGWTVGFALVKPLENPDAGIAVTMDAKGRGAIVQHMGINLKSLEPRLE